MFSLLLLSAVLAQTPPEVDVRPTLKKIAEKCADAKEFSFEGEMVLSGQRGAAPGKVLAKAKIRMALSDPGKYFLRIQDEGKDEYQLVSNGQKTWAFVPKLKQYTESESAALVGEDEEEGASDTERDMAETYARLIVPALGRMWKTAAAAGAGQPHQVKYEGQKQTWPSIQVQSKKDEKGGYYLTELAADPEGSRIGYLRWTHASFDGGEKTLIQLVMDFQTFHAGEPLAPDTFSFTPPSNAKMVDVVPIPGQTGSVLLNQPAPDFELKTFDGEKIHLSSLRGRPVLLAFWASWCGPCRRELPGVSKLNEEFKDKGLLVLGVNDEGKGDASKFIREAGLSFATLDDSSMKAHRLYRVRAIPSAFLIDANGKVVRFLRGGRDEATLRAALKSAGL